MIIKCLMLGDFGTNCFVVHADEQASQCLVIDPGFDAEPLVKFLQGNALQPGKILLTHGHCDHIAGIPLLLKEFGKIPVAIHSADAKMLTSSRDNLALMMGTRLSLEPADEELSNDQTVEFDRMQFQVLATPGHTPGGISFYSSTDGVVFSGDALFAGGIGRTDFPGGDSAQLQTSIRDVLLTLPPDTKVYSGHGPVTTIGTEKATNPFLAGAM